MDNALGVEPQVLYDADCGFCTVSARAMTRPWLRARVLVKPFQSVDLEALGLSMEECGESLHVLSDGKTYTGGAAIARVLRSGRAPWPVLGRLLTLPGVAWVVERAYRLVARNRHRLPGGSAACELPPRP